MEDFIYVILVIVWLLVSFLKKKPKQTQPSRKQEPAPHGETPAEPGKEMSMEDMFEEFLGGGKKKKEQKEESPIKEVVYEAGTYDQYEAVDDVDEEDAVQPAFEDFSGKSGVSEDFEFSAEGKIKTIDELIEAHKRKEAIELAKIEEAYGGKESADIPEFNLRDAVIFSEILNKKYN